MARYFKVILIGDSSVGKTSIRKRYLGQGFKEDYLVTLGVDLSVKTHGPHRIQIWDIAGHHSFRSVVKEYYRGAEGVLLVFDRTNITSLENIESWLLEVQKIMGNPIPIPIIILGNKSDLVGDGVGIPDEEVQEKLTQLTGLLHAEFKMLTTSALTGENIDKAFELLLKDIIEVE